MMNLLRILAGFTLLGIGALMMVFLEPGSLLEEAFFGLEWAAQLFSLAVFFTGVFHVMPRPWAWGNTKAGPVRRLARGLWALISGVGAVAALALFGLAGLDIMTGGWQIALLELLIGTLTLFASAEQLRNVWLRREAELADEDPAQQAAVSNVILRIARQHGGRITPAEVAASSNLHYRDAAAHLQEMADDGICAPQVNEHGGLFFYFAEFANPGAKRDILDPAFSTATPDEQVVFDHQRPQTSSHDDAEVHHHAAQSAGRSKG